MIDSFNRRAGAPDALSTPARANPDPGFAARSRLAGLRDALVRATRAPRPRWNEPACFFFDPKRQAELEAARPAAPRDELADRIAAELPELMASVEVRRVARATAGLRAAAELLGPRCAAARDLSDLLAVPDDEVFVALAPREQAGVRLHVRGCATVGQLQRLLSPQLGSGPFQLFAPSAVDTNGVLASGLAACEHWLWPTQPLCAVPRRGSERVVIVGPATVRPSLEVEPRFPDLATEYEMVEVMSAFRVMEALSRLSGTPRPIPAPLVARAA